MYPLLTPTFFVFTNTFMITVLGMELNISENMNTRISLSLCIIEASRRYFNSNAEIITYSMPLMELNRNISTTAVLSELVLPYLEAEQRYSVLIKNFNVSHQSRQQYLTKSYSYIIQIRTEGEFDENIKQLKKFLRWNPHAKFLVVSSFVFKDPQVVALKIIKSLWHYNVINSIVLLASKENTTNFNVYSWQPYSYYSCGDNFTETNSMDTCAFGISANNVSWFASKIPKQLYKCPIKVKYLVWPPFVTDAKVISQVAYYDEEMGVDINLLNIIANTINLSLIYEKSSFKLWGVVDSSFSATKDLKLLKENKIDLVAGGYAKTTEAMFFFDYGSMYAQQSLVWCVPHIPIITGFKNLVSVLQPKVWVALCILYFVTSFCMWYISVHDVHEYLFYKNIFSCLLNNFLILIGFTVNKFPKTNKVRYVIIIFIMFSFNINTLYTSYLTSILSSPHIKEKYGTMEEIYKNNLRTYFIPHSIRFFEGSDDVDEMANVPLSTVRERWRNCSNIPHCFSLIASRSDSAVCMPRLFKDYLLKGPAKKQKKDIYCLKENVVTLPITIIMRKGFPLLNLFNSLITKIVEAGFVDKWTKDILMDKHGSNQDNSMDSNSDINFKNIVSVLYVLIFGYCIGFLVFIVEILVHNF